MLESNEELNRKFMDVIRKLSTHDKYFRVVFDDLEVANCKPQDCHSCIEIFGWF